MSRSLRSILLLTLAGAAPAGAQEDTLRRIALDTLTVTVLRAPLSPLRAPAAVTVLSGAELSRARPGLALDQALLLVPGVQVDNRFNPALGERISVRGFGARTQFGVRGVRVLVDGIPATFPDGQTALNHVDPASLQRVEVVRGPAAALYGNASGGVIRLESAPPADAPLAARVRASAGADGARRTQVTAGGMSGGAWYRADLTRLTGEGYRRHAHAESWLGRGTAGVALGAHDLRLAWSWVDYRAENPGSLSDSLLRVDRRQAFARNVAQGTGEAGTQRQAGLAWTGPAGPLRVEVTAYGTLREVDNPIPTHVIVLDRRVGGLRAAAGDALRAGGLAIRWSAGAELESQRDDRRNFVNEAGERGALAIDQRETVRNRAAFALVTLSLAERMEVLAAARHDRFRFAALDRMPPTVADPDDSGARTFSATSPTLGASLAVAPGAWLYANLATAFETPTTTELVNRPDSAGGFNPDLLPQRTLSREAGARVRLGRIGRVELAAYHARVRDQLVPFEVATAPGRVFFRNAGLSRHRGAEAALTLAPAAWLTLRGAYTYTDARFVEYRVGEVDVGGQRVPGIAPHRLAASAWAGGAAGAFAGVELRSASATPVSDTDAEGRFRSPGHTVVDLRAGWADARALRLRATPWIAVSNALDARYNASVVVNAFGGRFYEPGPGRAIYLGLEAGTR